MDKSAQKAELQKFVKFCVVGASSFTIDTGIAYLLIFTAHQNFYLSKTISFTLAVTNGFIWNRRWTFQEEKHNRKQSHQYGMFFAVNVVGYFLNLTISTIVQALETGTWVNPKPSKLVFLVATIIATAITVMVAVWRKIFSKLLL